LAISPVICYNSSKVVGAKGGFAIALGAPGFQLNFLLLL